MNRSVRLLLVSGSLRALSTNSAVLRTARALSPPGLKALLYAGMADLPQFNPDDDGDPLHPVVAEMRTRIRRADAVLFSTPEYAGALPGSFKNLLDWAVGDGQPRSIYQKPVAWINASPTGAVHAHDSLRTVLGYLHADLVEEACAHIPVPRSAVDDDGMIASPAIRQEIAGCIERLAHHVDTEFPATD